MQIKACLVFEQFEEAVLSIIRWDLKYSQISDIHAPCLLLEVKKKSSRQET